MTALDDYLMENDEEAIRLELKTSPEAVMEEAKWCGLAPGMRVLDAGCGPGFVTSILSGLIGPDGYILGLDYSQKRIEYATRRYARPGKVEFLLHDLRRPIQDLGHFDLVWARFVLEYFRDEAPNIVGNLHSCLRPGGTLCLLDLDYNCLSHYELPPGMEYLLGAIMNLLERDHNFDPFIGRKLYSFLYDLGYQNIEVSLKAHHLIYGPISEQDTFNWTKKIEVVTRKAPDLFDTYKEGLRGFLSDFTNFFLDPRRFTYTPLIMCKGRKPVE
jgi:SAM-dependent methyltransferase